MTKSKINYQTFNSFASFDLNECCEHFDCESQAQWKKIGRFIVADGQEYAEVMEQAFDLEDTGSASYEAFEAGVKYALTKMNTAFEAAGLDLQICEVDLVESMGFILVRADDEPEDFVKRALKKPVLMVDSWI